MTDDSAPRLILASASPRRRELFALLGVPFESVATHIDESVRPGEAPRDYARRVSREKAQAAAGQTTGHAIIVACDTTVADGETILGKPLDAAEAEAMLRRLRGKTHTVYTAVTMIYLTGDQMISQVAASPVRMRDTSDDEIAAYVASGDPFDKAGAYAIQNAGFHPVERFSHCAANVMGLPLCHVTRMLRQMGVEPPRDVPIACQRHIEYACPVFESILANSA